MRASVADQFHSQSAIPWIIGFLLPFTLIVTLLLCFEKKRKKSLENTPNASLLQPKLTTTPANQNLSIGAGATSLQTEAKGTDKTSIVINASIYDGAGKVAQKDTKSDSIQAKKTKQQVASVFWPEHTPSVRKEDHAKSVPSAMSGTGRKPTVVAKNVAEADPTPPEKITVEQDDVQVPAADDKKRMMEAQKKTLEFRPDHTFYNVPMNMDMEM